MLNSTQANITCFNNYTRSEQWQTQTGSNPVERYALLESGPEPIQFFKRNMITMSPGLVGKLQDACAAPTNTSAQTLCGRSWNTNLYFGSECEAPLTCEFNNQTFTLLGAPVEAGNNTIQLGIYNFGQTEQSAYARCVTEQLPAVAAAGVKSRPVVSKASSHASRSKAALAAAALLAAGLFLQA